MAHVVCGFIGNESEDLGFYYINQKVMPISDLQSPASVFSKKTSVLAMAPILFSLVAYNAK